MIMDELDGTKERKGKGKRVQEAGQGSDKSQREGHLQRRAVSVGFCKRGQAKASLEGRSLRTRFFTSVRGAGSPQPVARQGEPHSTCSSLKVEMFTILSCQIVPNPRHSHPKTKPTHPSNLTANVTSSMKSSPVLTVWRSHNNMYFSCYFANHTTIVPIPIPASQQAPHQQSL